MSSQQPHLPSFKFDRARLWQLKTGFLMLGMIALTGSLLGCDYEKTADQMDHKLYVMKQTLSKRVHNFDRWAHLKTYQKIISPPKIIPPDLKSGTCGKNIPNQWLGPQDGRFVLTASASVPIYPTPQDNQDPCFVLHRAERVRVVFENAPSPAGKTDHWVFIVDDEGTTNRGWVKDKDLGFKDRFKPVESMRPIQFYFQKYKYCATYNVHADGTFEKQWASNSDGYNMAGTQNGKVSKFNNLVVMIDDDPEEWTNFFWMKSDTEWVSEWKYVGEPFRMLSSPPQK